MITLQRGNLRIEVAAVPEPNGFCCVTAEVFEGRRMVRGYYRRMQAAPDEFRAAEINVAKDVARMSGESE
jgi:hypothetical protein